MMADLIGVLSMVSKRSFSVGFSLVVFGIKAGLVVINTWAELIAASISLHLRLFRSFIIWMIAIVSLPVRISTALRKQRMLEERLVVAQAELADVNCERKVLEDHLRLVLKECNDFDSLLTEAEDETDKLVAKIQLLEQQLSSTRDENHQLKLIQGEQVGKLGQNIRSYEGSAGVNVLENQAQRKSDVSSGRSGIGIRKNLKEVIEQREVAFWQSVLSAVLSLAVGMIIWEAKDANCMPLVVALYTVVGMSMKNVVKFFSTIDNKPASDAVALLSFNCFILGTLTYPTLPRLLRTLASLASTYFTPRIG
ncbi:hypothetical protein LINGRAHAP2_LOCUS13953 [Linum grandiflorum]